MLSISFWNCCLVSVGSFLSHLWDWSDPYDQDLMCDQSLDPRQPYTRLLSKFMTSIVIPVYIKSFTKISVSITQIGKNIITIPYTQKPPNAPPNNCTYIVTRVSNHQVLRNYVSSTIHIFLCKYFLSRNYESFIDKLAWGIITWNWQGFTCSHCPWVYLGADIRNLFVWLWLSQGTALKKNLHMA